MTIFEAKLREESNDTEIFDKYIMHTSFAIKKKIDLLDKSFLKYFEDRFENYLNKNFSYISLKNIGGHILLY